MSMSPINISMKVMEIVRSTGNLESALADGWVKIRYTRLDGMSRILMATTNPDLYSYTHRRRHRRLRKPGIILVWEHRVGWRALYRSRIGGWKPAY